MISMNSKSNRIAFRVTDAQRQTIAELASVCGRSVSDYVRDLALCQPVHPLPKIPAANLKIYAELGKIGGNVNQIAKSLNEGLSIDAGAQRIAHALPSLVSLLKEIRLQLTKPPAAELEDEAM